MFPDFEAAVSVSIGIVTVAGVEAATADPLVLLRNADAAMYRAKREGKSRWALFDESLLSAAAYRRELDPDLRRALAADQFVLHYQPVYDLHDFTIVGVEALVRWSHPTRGLPASHRLHRARRRDRPHRRHRHVGAARILQPDAQVGRRVELAGMDVGQLLGAASGATGARRRRERHPRDLRRARRPASPRTDGDRVAARRALGGG